MRFGLTLNGWLMDHDDGTPVSPEAWHALLGVLDPALPVDAGWLWALGEAVCEDLRAMRLSVEAPPSVEDVQAGCAESEAWWAAHSADL